MSTAEKMAKALEESNRQSDVRAKARANGDGVASALDDMAARDRVSPVTTVSAAPVAPDMARLQALATSLKAAADAIHFAAGDLRTADMWRAAKAMDDMERVVLVYLELAQG